SPAHAGLKIRAVFDETQPPPPPCTAEENVRCMVGGGNLEDIARVAANNWERVFRGGGRWDLTITFAWETISFCYGQAEAEHFGGTPERTTQARVRLNNRICQYGFFADPTPRDHTEYSSYEAHLLPEVPLNRGRIFGDATGDAEDRIDLLTVVTHEI